MRTPDMDYEPDDEEQAVLDVLREHGRANPMLIRDETDLRKEYVSRALTGLQKAGVVQKVVRGLYEHIPENDDEFDSADDADLRARLQNALEARDDQRAKADRLEVELEDCRERLEQAQANGSDADLGRAREGVSAAAGRVSEALGELPQQEALIQPKLEAAQSELEAVEEVLEDE